MIRGTKTRLAKIVNRYAAGGLTPAEFTDRMDALLDNRHTRAAMLGRQRAGDPAPANFLDSAYSAAVMREERRFLNNFRADLEAGRYNDADGQVRASVVKNRALSYAEKLTGTASETFVLASGPNALFDWRLGIVAEHHCPDCPALAANGPYSGNQLPTVPKAGATKCVFNCSCFLVRNDGIAGFMPTQSK